MRQKICTALIITLIIHCPTSAMHHVRNALPVLLSLAARTAVATSMVHSEIKGHYKMHRDLSSGTTAEAEVQNFVRTTLQEHGIAEDTAQSITTYRDYSSGSYRLWKHKAILLNDEELKSDIHTALEQPDNPKAQEAIHAWKATIMHEYGHINNHDNFTSSLFRCMSAAWILRGSALAIIPKKIFSAIAYDAQQKYQEYQADQETINRCSIAEIEAQKKYFEKLHDYFVFQIKIADPSFNEDLVDHDLVFREIMHKLVIKGPHPAHLTRANYFEAAVIAKRIAENNALMAKMEEENNRSK